MPKPEKVVVRVSRRGEVVLPAPIRKAFGLKDGGRVELELVDGKIVLAPMVGLGTALYGLCKPLPTAPSSEEIFREIDEASEC